MDWRGNNAVIARLEDETLPLQLDRSTLDTQSLFTDYILESFSPSLIQQSLTFFFHLLLFFSCCCRGPDAGIWKTHPTDWKVRLLTCFFWLNKMQCAVVLLVLFFLKRKSHTTTASASVIALLSLSLSLSRLPFTVSPPRLWKVRSKGDQD